MREWQKMVLCIVTGLSMVAVIGVVQALDLQDTGQRRRFMRRRVEPIEESMFSGVAQAYQIDSDTGGNTNYIRYTSGTGNIFIKKIATVGTVTTIEKAITNWTARSNATYVAINN